VKKPVPVESIALDTSRSHISRRSQVQWLATQPSPGSIPEIHGQVPQPSLAE